MSTDPVSAQSSSRFSVIVWCPDCNGVDFEGCFGGGAETHGPFASRGEAQHTGEEATRNSAWLYEIEEGS